MSVVYTAVLEVSEDSVLFLSGLLHAERVRRGTRALADLGYEGEPETFKIPFKKPKDGQLTVDQQACNAIHGALRCLGERANSLRKTTYKALRRYRGCPWRLGDITAAGLVLLHHDRRT